MTAFSLDQHKTPFSLKKTLSIVPPKSTTLELEAKTTVNGKTQTKKRKIKLRVKR